MTTTRTSYLIMGATYLIVGVSGIWGVDAALWALPVVLLGFGIWGLTIAAKTSKEKDARHPS